MSIASSVHPATASHAAVPPAARLASASARATPSAVSTPCSDSQRPGNWSVRVATCPEKWDLPLAVLLEGKIVGLQALHASSFPVLRDIHTGSYLSPSARGKGLGVRMRALALELAFGHLSADSCSSGYAVGNDASAGVSARLGYLDDGTSLDAYAGVKHTVRRLRLPRSRWLEHRPGWMNNAIARGVPATRALLGLDE